MTGLTVPTIKARLTLSSDDRNRHKGTNMSYAGVLNSLLGI